MAFEKTQNKLDELRNLTLQNGKLVELLSQLSVNGLETELQQGKSNIVDAIKSKGVDASQEESMTSLADKITKIKEVEVKTLPAETSNEKANDLFNMIMKSQNWDSIYETVYENYVTNGGYVGVLMTALERGTRTSIELTGADAYYILEEDKFYTTDGSRNLVTFINGVETPLGTKNHLWDINNAQYWRYVFYLYIDGSTADGSRENVHPSVFDYCRDSNIPNIQYKSNSGNVMHFHVSNPDTCNLKWNGGTTANTRCYYFYANVENANAQWMLQHNGNNLTFVDFSALKKLTSGTLLQASRVRDLDFPNLESISGGTLISQCNALESVDLSNLQSISGGTLISQCNALESVDLSNLEEINSKNSQVVINGNFDIIFPKLRKANSGGYIITGNYKNLIAPILEEWSGGNSFIVNNTEIEDLYIPNIEIISGNIANNCGKLKTINLPKLKSLPKYGIGVYALNNLPLLEECLMPELEQYTIYGAFPFGFTGLPKLRHISFKSVAIQSTQWFYDGTAVDLIWIELTDFPNKSINLQHWNPTNAVLSDSKSLVDNNESYSSNLEKFRDKFKTSIAERLSDRVGQSSLTLTFNSNVVNALTDEIKQIITNKNWNLASV